MHRAYSVLQTKSIDDGERVIRGVATSPEVDRVGDIVDPLGVRYKNPLPLLWQHQHEKPVGTVKFDAPTKDGVTFEARLPVISEPGTLKDRVDEAWQSIKSGLVAAVSIGFRPIDGAVETLKTGGLKFLKTEVYELSLVTIPANASAVIQAIKAFDKPPASGHSAVTSPGVSGHFTAAQRAVPLISAKGKHS